MDLIVSVKKVLIVDEINSTLQAQNQFKAESVFLFRNNYLKTFDNLALRSIDVLVYVTNSYLMRRSIL